jgi:hypothetical protein
MLELLIAFLVPPTPTLPPDDPGFEHCIDPGPALELRWRPPDDGAASWLLVKRRYENGAWRTWLKSYVSSPPFSLNMQDGLARNGDFAWLLFGVDREEGDYAAGDWHYFCTRD